MRSWRLDRIRVGRLIRRDGVMKVIELENKNVKLGAEEGKIIQSKAMYFDEELGQDVPNVQGRKIYLGRNDDVENYKEIEEKEEM